MQLAQPVIDGVRAAMQATGEPITEELIEMVIDAGLIDAVTQQAIDALTAAHGQQVVLESLFDAFSDVA